jgi:hypothetical protein
MEQFRTRDKPDPQYGMLGFRSVVDILPYGSNKLNFKYSFLSVYSFNMSSRRWCMRLQDRGAWDLVVPLLTPEDKDRIESFEVCSLFKNGQLEVENSAWFVKSK